MSTKALFLCVIVSVSFISSFHGTSALSLNNHASSAEIISGVPSVRSLPAPPILPPAPPKTCPLVLGKRVVGCNHKDFKVKVPKIEGKLSVSMSIKKGKVTATITAPAGATIFRAGYSAFGVGFQPATPPHKAIVKYCHGVNSVMAMTLFNKLKIPKGAKNCCKAKVFLSWTVTLCNKKFEHCATKSFVKGIKVICVNVCRGEGKGGVSIPMSDKQKCPFCKTKY